MDLYQHPQYPPRVPFDHPPMPLPWSGFQHPYLRHDPVPLLVPVHRFPSDDHCCLSKLHPDFLALWRDYSHGKRVVHLAQEVRELTPGET